MKHELEMIYHCPEFVTLITSVILIIRYLHRKLLNKTHCAVFGQER